MKNKNLDKNKYIKIMQRKIIIIPFCLSILLCACSAPLVDSKQQMNDEHEQVRQVMQESVSIINP